MTVVKKIFQFTLVLKNVDDKTEGLEDSLYQAGCDDALINFRNGTVYLDFERKDTSFEGALIKAIQDVESSSIGAVVENVAPENLVTEADIAKRLNVTRQTVSLWINGARKQKNPFPKPIMKLSDRSPMWRWSDVARWREDDELINKAVLVENLNAALESRQNPRKIKIRQAALLKKVGRLKTVSRKTEHTKSKPPVKKTGR